MEFANAATSSLETMESQMDLIKDFQSIQAEMSESVQNASGEISRAAAEALRSVNDTSRRIESAHDAMNRSVTGHRNADEQPSNGTR